MVRPLRRQRISLAGVSAAPVRLRLEPLGEGIADCAVLAGRGAVGRVCYVPGLPQPWFWGTVRGDSGYELSRDAALAALTRAWGRNGAG